eukprot:TRINITY_DN12614_c0_g1_i3.p1 TRINITY_DN12614_c0_g1~~TRINITY_DN12614_c0_g1_i3.p1  ORF type:complete len:316 (+),score=23.89 TRINITY_DN12614_c0_g1_i3:96-1043(+)
MPPLRTTSSSRSLDAAGEAPERHVSGFDAALTNLGIVNALAVTLVVADCWFATQETMASFLFQRLLCCVPEFREYATQLMVSSGFSSVENMGHTAFNISAHLGPSLGPLSSAGASCPFEAACQSDAKFHAASQLLFADFPHHKMWAWANVHSQHEIVRYQILQFQLPQTLFSWSLAMLLLAMMVCVIGLVAMSLTPAKQHRDAFRSMAVIHAPMVLIIILLTILGMIFFIVAHNMVMRYTSAFYEITDTHLALYPWHNFFIPALIVFAAVYWSQIHILQRKFADVHFLLAWVPGLFVLSDLTQHVDAPNAAVVEV